jgi:preprotein translocase subunit SecG
MQLAVSIVMVIACLFLIVTILLQHGADAGASGAVVGGAAESFLGKNKDCGIDAVLGKVTTIVAIVFMVCALALNVI